MNVGVTGGTGFVGRWLVAALLARGDQVRVLSRRTAEELDFPPSVEICTADLTVNGRDLASFIEGLDTLYHCAGEARVEARMREVHVEGTGNLLRAAAGRLRHWVQLSSVGAYGARRSGIVSEDDPLLPHGAYEVTKTEAETLVIDSAPEYGLTYTVIRPCKILGIGMRDRSLYSMFPLVARRAFFYIGAPDAMLNYVHVEDVARALAIAGVDASARNKTYNLAQQITVEAFVGAVAKALGVRTPGIRLPEAPTRAIAALTAWSRSPLTVGRIDGLTSRVVYSSERIVRELGYEFAVPIATGIRELVADWQASRG